MNDTSISLSEMTGITGDAENPVLVPEPTKAKKAKLADEVIAPDPVSKAVHHIENLNAAQAAAMVTELKEGSEFNLFQLGGVLSLVNNKKWFAEWGHPNFASWVEKEHGLHYRKAQYLVGIYEQIVELSLPWDKIQGLGWTKLKVLLNPKLNLVTADNIASWVEKAESMTVIQLEAYLKSLSAGPDGAAIEQDGEQKVTTMTFKLHDDQKELIRAALEKVKSISGTKHDTVALEQLATDFMGTPIAQATPAPVTLTTETMVSVFKERGYEDVLVAFEEAFPDITLTLGVPAIS